MTVLRYRIAHLLLACICGARHLCTEGLATLRLRHRRRLLVGTAQVPRTRHMLHRSPGGCRPQEGSASSLGKRLSPCPSWHRLSMLGASAGWSEPEGRDRNSVSMGPFVHWMSIVGRGDFVRESAIRQDGERGQLATHRPPFEHPHSLCSTMIHAVYFTRSACRELDRVACRRTFSGGLGAAPPFFNNMCPASIDHCWNFGDGGLQLSSSQAGKKLAHSLRMHVDVIQKQS